MQTIKLKACDGEPISVDVEVARRRSKFLKGMLDNLGNKVGDDDNVISLVTFKHDVLAKVVEWMVRHKDDPPEDEEVEDELQEKRADDICGWDAEFLKVDQTMIFDLVMAAYHLNIKGLLDTTIEMVAKMMEGITPVEVRRNFNINNDFISAVEEKQLLGE